MTFEYTFQIVVLYPLIISLASSYIVSKYLGTNLYHTLMELKKLPVLPKLMKPSMINKTAKDIMITYVNFLEINSTNSDVAIILNKNHKNHK